MTISTTEVREEARSIHLKMAPVNERMFTLLEQYQDRHKILSPDQFALDQINPDLVPPAVKKAVFYTAAIEGGPNGPAERILESSEQSGATWSTAFVRGIWHPEETGHGELLREVAIACGAASAQEIDKVLTEVRARDFSIGRGYNALGTGIYTWFQEEFTWAFYTGVRRNTSDKVMQNIFYQLSKQEKFHGFVQKEGLKTLVQYNPEFLEWMRKEMARYSGEFMMPDRVMAPGLQHSLGLRSESYGISFRSVLKNIATGLIPLLGFEGIGRAAISYAINDPEDVLPGYLKLSKPVLWGLQKANRPRINSFIGQQFANYILKAA